MESAKVSNINRTKDKQTTGRRIDEQKDKQTDSIM